MKAFEKRSSVGRVWFSHILILGACLVALTASWEVSVGGFSIPGVPAGLTGAAAQAGAKTFVVVQPGTHPGIVFSAAEIPALKRRTQNGGTAAKAYQRLKAIAADEFPIQLTPPDAVGREGHRLARQLQALALIYQVEGDQEAGARAIELFKVATAVDPWAFHREVAEDFFATEHWPEAFAFAWDWLYPLMSEEDRSTILSALEAWSAALFDHTESWWWREAQYNCGAIPVGANGLLVTAIQAESRHPELKKWFAECLRKSKENYFPLTWSDDGFCNEGPGYAHYHKNPTLFGEAIRRTGGEDIISTSGAVNAMHYLRHQWMPQGGCAPIGDNTEYGRRVFQSIYLHGVRETRDRAGLWTFEKFTDFDRIDPLFIFLFSPDGFFPASPKSLKLPTSYYFEFDQYRSGTVFARSEWDDPRAAWFAFVTRYSQANHTHCDMSSFLFSAFGDQFATHANIFGYGHDHHGVDFEHNLIVVDEGGMPANDRRNSAGDDGSVKGLLTGLALGDFADYVSGDATGSYADPTVPSSTPAERAERIALFVKQGDHPYIVITDDFRQDDTEHDYHWQWYMPEQELTGSGSPQSPFLVQGSNATCRIILVEPSRPQSDFRIVTGGSQRRPIRLGLLRVNRRAVETRFLAVAIASRKDAATPRIETDVTVSGNPSASAFAVVSDAFRDLVVWQPRTAPGAASTTLKSGPIETDARLAMVRVNQQGEVAGYVLGEGRRLSFAGQDLVLSSQVSSVTAHPAAVSVNGLRRAHEGLPPLPAQGRFRVPGFDRGEAREEAQVPLLVDGQLRDLPVDSEGFFRVVSP